ncbi:hypothetical protein M404DRAFT_727710 [Pisolithus tinctorius Marx 270]|uniref:Uncharacterized protein n=1 Tax=Pisolithus tinctorius Marx 270 TaxID=870435 RepID=A0A0C3P2R4_PISTI|nr:hypothetical protein M404DRAFT_727710 [Pisolithus tinctorius Marx 270]
MRLTVFSFSPFPQACTATICEDQLSGINRSSVVMHPCLRVYDILQLIFRCVEDRSTLCALARTCRTFNEPATALIWETLTAMEPILSQLSSARIVSTRKYIDSDYETYLDDRYLELSRPLTDNDWNIIRRLSSRVRRFHLTCIPIPRDDYADDNISQRFHLLASPPDPSFLFPNLRTLSYNVRDDNIRSDHKHAIIRFFHLLLKPHLSALRFELPDSLYSHLDISSIPVLCPNIRILNIGCTGFLIDGVSTRGSDQLTRMLSGLAQVKGLRRLSVSLPPILGPRSECPSGETFPQLRTLDVFARSVASCTELFRWTSLDKVTEIYIDCSLCDRDPVQTLVEMSFLILSQCKRLEFLWILSDHSDNGETPTAWPRPMLEVYQAFRQLRVIALQTCVSPTLADDDLEDMVKAWPHLEVFHLFYEEILCPPVHLTLRGVTALLYHCPKLNQFTLMFDATHVPAPLGYSTLVQNTALRYMGVWASPVSASPDVAAYLSTIMPYLRDVGIYARNRYDSEWLWICARHQQKLTIMVNMSRIELYNLLTAGTERGGDPVESHSGEWCWTSREDWHRYLTGYSTQVV